jgi:thioredoxin 1
MVPSPSISGRAFNSEVLAASSPVLVNFWAPWCGLCRTIEPTIRQLLEETPMPVKLARVNADENLRLAKTYHITHLPTLLVFNQGKIVHRAEGVEEVKQLMQQWEVILTSLAPATVNT